MDRRGFLKGIAGILSAGYSASVLPSGVIMPVKKLWTPPMYGLAVASTEGFTPYAEAYSTHYGTVIKEILIYESAHTPAQNDEVRKWLNSNIRVGDAPFEPVSHFIYDAPKPPSP